MKKGNVIIIIIIIFTAICLSIIGTRKSKSGDVWQKYYQRSSEGSPTEEKNETVKEITIYDIEDGYMNVPYNDKAIQNTYNWDKSLKNNNGIYSYEDENYKSKLGIDVSSYQKDINWKKVKDAGVEFAILRLGYRGYGESGKLVEDPMFEKNYANAKKEGIEIGVYFFSQSVNEDEIQEEVEFVCNKLEGKELSYPVVFDLEKIKNDEARTDNLTTEEITNMTGKFCELIEEKGYTPSIYGNAKTFTTKMKLEQFNNYSKWYADYQEKPIYIYDFEMWQYTESGKIDGIKENVDLNIQFLRK